MIVLRTYFIFFFIFFTTTCNSNDNKLSNKQVFCNDYNLNNCITIMTFNVENLFDNYDNPKKNDNTFLPLKNKNNIIHKKECEKISRKDWRKLCLNLDWNKKKLEKKLNSIAQTLSQINSEKGPDILLLQEVENQFLLEQFRKKYSKFNYKKSILLTGADYRGINVGMLTRLKTIGKPKLYLHPFYKKINKGQRGILYVKQLLPDDNFLHIFILHAFAPYHPWKIRKKLFPFLNKITKELRDKNEMIIIGGDFNLPSQRKKEISFFKKHIDSKWLISHFIGCANCKGSVYYSKEKIWSFFDMFLLSKNFIEHQQQEQQTLKLAPWYIDTNLIQIANFYSEQVIINKFEVTIPKSYDFYNDKGVSDHWPIVITIKKRESK